MAELLLTCHDLAKAYGRGTLFRGVSFSIVEGERIALVGPNGSGKTTLVQVLAGVEEPDEGVVTRRRELVVGYVPQDPTFPAGSTVEAVVLEALDGSRSDEQERSTRASIALSRAGFEDPLQRVGVLSGGWRKRLAIARELARGPDLLLLDEPTNHLDIEGIVWLEGLLGSVAHTFLVVSHDRYFLENVVGRVLELAPVWPDNLFEVRGGYRRFLAKKDAALAGQASYREALANRVRREMDWLAHKARARTRKAKARIGEAYRVADELQEVDSRTHSVRAGIELADTGRRTRRLVAVRDVSRGFGGSPVVTNLKLVLSPGTRLGVVGDNGSGKTTVLRLLSGDLEPDAGVVERVAGLKVVHFEQDRSALDGSQTLRESLLAQGDVVVHQEQAVHIVAWAKRFLFSADQLDQPVERLSGGEQARVLLARLMLEPADVLLLDEPTNDLDISTLEALEESLLEFSGALVLVTHDRYLLDRVANQILALDGEGGTALFADYSQWEAAVAEPGTPQERSCLRPRRVKGDAPAGLRRLSYRERLEWEGMEDAILASEAALDSAAAKANDPAIATDAEALHEAVQLEEEAQAEVDRLYERWTELEALQK